MASAPGRCAAARAAETAAERAACGAVRGPADCDSGDMVCAGAGRVADAEEGDSLDGAMTEYMAMRAVPMQPKAEHPLYPTTSHVIGLKSQPDKFRTTWLPKNNTFTKGYQGMTRHTGLNTYRVRSRVHSTLDARAARMRASPATHVLSHCNTRLHVNMQGWVLVSLAIG